MKLPELGNLQPNPKSEQLFFAVAQSIRYGKSFSAISKFPILIDLPITVDCKLFEESFLQELIKMMINENEKPYLINDFILFGFLYFVKTN